MHPRVLSRIPLAILVVVLGLFFTVLKLRTFPIPEGPYVLPIME